MRILIDGTECKAEGTILSSVVSMGKDPDSYIYLIDGVPVPSDSSPPGDTLVKAVRVASGG